MASTDTFSSITDQDEAPDMSNPAAQAGGSKHKVEISDLYRFRLIADPQVSPDGKTAAYVQIRLRKKPNDYASNIWLAPTDGSEEARKFTGSDKRDTSPRWSADGKQLAFLSTRSGKAQVWTIRTDGGEAQQITRGKHSVSELAWSPDGKWIAYISAVDNDEDRQRAEDARKSGKSDPETEASHEGRDPGGVESEEGLPVTPRGLGEWEEDAEEEERGEDKGEHARIITWTHFKADGAGLLERRQHLFIVPSGSGKARQLIEGDWNASTPRWSPDGKQLAYLANVEPDADYTNIRDIFAIPLDNGTPGESRRVTNHDSALATFDWLPDGNGFYATGHQRIEEGALGSNLQVWAISNAGEITKLTESFDRSAVDVVNSDLRSSAGEVRPRISRDGTQIYFMATNGGNCQVFAVPVAGGEVRQVIGGDRQVLNFGLAESSVIFDATTPTLPNDLFAADLDGGNERKLTNVNADVLSELEFSEPHLFAIETAPGITVEGWLMMPYGYQAEQKYPMVLQIHGGPHTAYGNAYFHEFQILCARGYIVLYTNPRGSQGYGQDFTDAILSDWGGVDYDDIMACVDYAIGTGSVDEERLGVGGGSYGGYMSGWIIGHTQRFKAAVASRMVSNLYSAWGSGDFTWRLWNWELQGTPQDRMALYMERSPISYVNEIKTPLLITHAADDLRCQIEQGDQMYTALKVLKRAVKMVRFPSGGHDVSRSGKPSLRTERLEQIAGWFDQYLKA